MVKRILIVAIRAYQVMISAVLGPRCRFYPSCSEYARQAIEEHGITKGVYLGSKRICKCHPFNPGGVDLVPPNKQGKVKQ